MKVLFIAHEYDLNGASKSLLGIIDEFIKEDISICVLTSYKNGKFIDELKKRKVDIIYSKFYRWIIRRPDNEFKWIIKKIFYKILNIFNLLTILKVSKYISMNKFDIIHTNSSVINIGAFISKISGVPHIFHIREFGEEDFDMYSIYDKKKMLNFINSNSRKIICVSKSVFYKYEKDFDYNKIVVIYNGINSDMLQEKKRIYLNKFRILLAGRIEKAKGQIEAMEAINILKKRGINNVTLSIIGGGNKEYLYKYVAENELEDLITIEDYCDNLFELRKSIDFELVCSKNEAFGRVTIEAMMSSNPVIGADTGGTRELIIDGYNGYMYRKGSPEDLAEKINIMISDEKKFEILSRNAFNYSKNKFTSEINSKNILKLYESIN